MAFKVGGSVVVDNDRNLADINAAQFQYFRLDDLQGNETVYWDPQNNYLIRSAATNVQDRYEIGSSISYVKVEPDQFTLQLDQGGLATDPSIIFGWSSNVLCGLFDDHMATSVANYGIGTAASPYGDLHLSGTANLTNLTVTGTITGIDYTNIENTPDLSVYSTTAYVDQSIAALVDTAPETLDTLNELAAALGDDPNFSTTITTQLSLKANTADLAPVATSGSYNDLTDQPINFGGANRVAFVNSANDKLTTDEGLTYSSSNNVLKLTGGFQVWSLGVDPLFNYISLDVNRNGSFVYVEDNANDNASGAGVTFRAADNPDPITGENPASIFAVRSSGDAPRLWVGQDVTSTGYNDLYVGTDNNYGYINPKFTVASATGNVDTEGTITAKSAVQGSRFALAPQVSGNTGYIEYANDVISIEPQGEDTAYFFANGNVGFNIANPTGQSDELAGNGRVVTVNSETGLGGSRGLAVYGDGGVGDYPIQVTDKSWTQTFVVFGDGDVANTNNAYVGLSDARLKQDITDVDIDKQLDDILNMQLHKYRMIADVEKDGDEAKEQIGLIAQELEAAGMSSLVRTDEEQDIKSVKYSVVNLKLLAAVQALAKRVEELESRLSE
jgi:hypothetical protein